MADDATSSVRVALPTPTTTRPSAPVADKPSAYEANKAAWNAFFDIDRRQRAALNGW